MRKKQIFLLCLLLLIATVPRAIELLNHNYLFGYDQGEHFLQVKKIIVDRHLTLIGTEVGGGGGFFQGPGWYYLLAIPFIISGGDPYAGMIFMFIIGLSVVLFAFFFTRKMFDDKTAFMVSLLLAISPVIIIQSRFIWPPFPIPFLTVFLLFFLYRVLQGKEKYLPFLALALGFMTHFETATAATLLISLLMFSPVIFFKKLVSFSTVLLSIMAFSLTQLPLIVFDIKHDFLNSKGILKLIFSSSSANPPIIEVFNNRWDVFRNNFFSTFPSGDAVWILLLVMIIGGGVSYMQDKNNPFAKKSFVIYLGVSPILLFMIFMKYGSFMWSWWILELNVYYCFLLGILLTYIWKKTFLKTIILGIFVLFIGSYAYQTLNFYKNDFNDFGGVHKIKGKMQALDYIYIDAKGKPFNLLVFTPPVYTYAYDYLVWWYGGKKYKYIPPQEKKGLFYLLIEPDPSKPWSYKGWLETVIKTGKIIETKELPSGFIIQKRIGERHVL